MQSMSTMALFSSPPTIMPTLSSKIHFFPHRHAKVSTFSLPKRTQLLFLARSADNGAGVVIEEKEETKKVEEEKKEVKKEESLGSSGTAAVKEEVMEVRKFKDARWVGGTWDLEQFKKGGVTDWDAVIDAEATRRKWLQDSPETSTNDEPVVFNSSIVPWWAWMKRFHLPEAEKLNGRAAMIGFFMSYFVDSLTGVGLVDQMGNFFCKTLLLVSVLGVLFIRKNEDLETLKKLWEETTFYDKQWQATWQEDSFTNSRKE